MEYTITTATNDHIKSIVEVGNDAFVADEFFKKPEYYQRFNPERVLSMLTAQDAVFLVALTSSNELVGCLYLQWEKIEETEKIKVCSIIVPLHTNQSST